MMVQDLLVSATVGQETAGMEAVVHGDHDLGERYHENKLNLNCLVHSRNFSLAKYSRPLI